MLMSILQDVGTYTGRAYENPYIISTFIGTRKSGSAVISLLMSILQDVGTYTGRADEKIKQFGHKNAHVHITGCRYIYGACL
jgi:hypothetical protein